MTAEERAYRRGALQAVQYLLADIADTFGDGREDHIERAARWQQALIAARESEHPRYLGCYLDTVRDDVRSKT